LLKKENKYIFIWNLNKFTSWMFFEQVFVIRIFYTHDANAIHMKAPHCYIQIESLLRA
jgi:lipid-A-disaccharide synthase-like uncharacterized protein